MGREVTVTDVKQISARIVSEIHEFCEKNNLCYVLFFGTLLGAIRHNGYIPWDDDVDIAMPRKDYEIFIKTYKSEHSDVISCKYNKKYPLHWAKVFDKHTDLHENIAKQKYEIGVYIDVFPLDEIDSEKRYLKLRKKENIWCKGLSLAMVKPISKNPIKMVLRHLLRLPFLGHEHSLGLKIDNYMQGNYEFNYYCCNDMYNLTNNIYIFDKNICDYRILHKFEEYEFYIPKSYDKVLTSLYNDYMKLPPIEQQVCHHEYKAFFK
ncbi:MAG: LicD family protein [Bacilli bacterium]|nr:LicD family protein [Bacilli bacterium]